MIKREHIKQAIRTISDRDHEIGYVLDEMLGMGRIRPAATDAEVMAGEDFYFFFDEKIVTVKKVIFFNVGTVSIEERLLIKYGEMMKRNELHQTGKHLSFADAAKKIRHAGLAFLVDHELDDAVLREKAHQKPDSGLVAEYHRIKQQRQPLNISWHGPADGPDVTVLYQGIVDAGKQALFVRFPFCVDALIQVADINLDFFHIRFLLSCLARGVAHNLFACVVDNRIEGMVFLTFKEQLFYRALEIQYIATVRGRPVLDTEPAANPLKGVGVFLVAGVWLFWKTRWAKAKELLLDSEIGARRFYQSVGFQSRGMSGFVMKHPKDRLVTAIFEMACHCPNLGDSVISVLARILKKQVKILLKKPEDPTGEEKRNVAVHLIKACLQDDGYPALGKTVAGELRRYRKKIPEARKLLELMGEE